MIWIAVVAGWFVAAPLIAWAMGAAVVLAEHGNPPLQFDEATDEACPAAVEVPADVATDYQPALAAAS